MSELEFILKENYGDDWKAIKREIQQEIYDALDNAHDPFEASDEVEDILQSYGLEPDYLTDFI